jgi:RNA polymerase sigma-70 factor (ECF subfamily)
VEFATDGELIASSVDDPEQFALIWERHHPDVFRFVARRVGRERAADLTSEVFVTAFRSRHKFDRTRPSSKPWLYGIAVNVIGDDLRRQRRRSARHLALAGLAVVDTDPYADKDDELDAESVAAVLDRAVGRLRRADREVLLLYALAELSYEEIAEALDIPVGTVRSRLSRTRSRLKRMIPDLERLERRLGGSDD